MLKPNQLIWSGQILVLKILNLLLDHKPARSIRMSIFSSWIASTISWSDLSPKSTQLSKRFENLSVVSSCWSVFKRESPKVSNFVCFKSLIRSFIKYVIEWDCLKSGERKPIFIFIFFISIFESFLELRTRNKFENFFWNSAKFICFQLLKYICDVIYDVPKSLFKPFDLRIFSNTEIFSLCLIRYLYKSIPWDRYLLFSENFFSASEYIFCEVSILFKSSESFRPISAQSFMWLQRDSRDISPKLSL